MVRIIEKNRARCEELSLLLPKALIINGDGKINAYDVCIMRSSASSGEAEIWLGLHTLCAEGPDLILGQETKKNLLNCMASPKKNQNKFLSRVRK